jgi:ArsR family transcriptional regulator
MTSEQDRVFERAAELFGLLSAPVRLRVVQALLSGERHVGELAEQVGTTQPNLSQHLTTLYRCGVLARRRVGAQVLYSIAADRRLMLERLLDRSPGAADLPSPHRTGVPQP